MVGSERETNLVFREHGAPIGSAAVDTMAGASPLVSVVLPKFRRGALLTVGEVHFLPKHMRRDFPRLERIRKNFKSWLEGKKIAYEWRRDLRPEEMYFFEAGILNIAERIYALPSGEPMLNDGTYFIADGANDYTLDLLCKTLRLRGVACAD